MANATSIPPICPEARQQILAIPECRQYRADLDRHLAADPDLREVLTEDLVDDIFVTMAIVGPLPLGCPGTVH